MKAIKYRNIPRGRVVTYLRLISAFRPEKEKQHRIRFTAGGNLIQYPGKTSTKAADLTTVKININSTLSTKDARFISFDLANLYLKTHKFVHDGYVYFEINKGMYGLPQAGKIANNQLITFLQPHGYRECPITPGLWKHGTRDATFCLVVDDFGIRYTNIANTHHLLGVL